MSHVYPCVSICVPMMTPCFDAVWPIVVVVQLLSQKKKPIKVGDHKKIAYTNLIGII